MGLLHNTSSGNRIILQAPTERVTVNLKNGEWSWVDPLNVTNFLYSAYEYHRYLECSYKYVGMDYDDAVDCADDIRSALTFDIYQSDWDPSVGDFSNYKAGFAIQGTVDVVKNVGHLYDIIVNISEHDVHLYKDPNRILAEVFFTERMRQYIV